MFDDIDGDGGMMISIGLGMGRGCSDYPHLCIDENKEAFNRGIHGDVKEFPNDRGRLRTGGIWHGTDPEYV